MEPAVAYHIGEAPSHIPYASTLHTYCSANILDTLISFNKATDHFCVCQIHIITVWHTINGFPFRKHDKNTIFMTYYSNQWKKVANDNDHHNFTHIAAVQMVQCVGARAEKSHHLYIANNKFIWYILYHTVAIYFFDALSMFASIPPCHVHNPLSVLSPTKKSVHIYPVFMGSLFSRSISSKCRRPAVQKRK